MKKTETTTITRDDTGQSRQLDQPTPLNWPLTPIPGASLSISEPRPMSTSVICQVNKLDTSTSNPHTIHPLQPHNAIRRAAHSRVCTPRRPSPPTPNRPKPKPILPHPQPRILPETGLCRTRPAHPPSLQALALQILYFPLSYPRPLRARRSRTIFCTRMGPTWRS